MALFLVSGIKCLVVALNSVSNWSQGNSAVGTVRKMFSGLVCRFSAILLLFLYSFEEKVREKVGERKIESE